MPCDAGPLPITTRPKPRPEPGPGAAPLTGGHRWGVAVGARAKLGLRVDYHVRISQKHELVGGNRREP